MTEYPESQEAKLWMGAGGSMVDLSTGLIRPGGLISYRRLKLGYRRRDDATQPGFRTNPDDIVFTFTPKKGVEALVDRAGGHRLGTGIYALRLLEPSRFDQKYFGPCLTKGWRQRGGTTERGSPRNLAIPLLEIESQRNWVEATTTLRATAREAEEVIEEAGVLDGVAMDFLRFGPKERAGLESPQLPLKSRTSQP
jgi:hypothetical protein